MLPQFFPDLPKSSHIFAQILLNAAQHGRNSAQNLPKSCQNPRKSLPKWIQKPLWSPSWVNAGKKLFFERAKNGQEAPKSAQKKPKTVPKPSKWSPRASPNPFLTHFLVFIFPFQICFDFFCIAIVFFIFLCRNLQSIDFFFQANAI